MILRVSHAIIKSVDLMRRTIKLQQVSDTGSEENLQYDYLIISLGAETHYFEVDGAGPRISLEACWRRGAFSKQMQALPRCSD